MTFVIAGVLQVWSGYLAVKWYLTRPEAEPLI